MTAIKQVSVIRNSHSKALGEYLDFNREKVCGHGSQHVTDEQNWQAEFEASRAAYGTEESRKRSTAEIEKRAQRMCEKHPELSIEEARKKIPKTADVNLMYHQCINWLPEECSMNGGKMNEKACLEYTRQYIERRYPNSECVYVLHREKCGRDNAERFSAHIAINNVDLESGKKLNDGLGAVAKKKRVEAIRKLDDEWGLQQLHRGKNSRIHERQPSRSEKQAHSKTGLAQNEKLRQTIAHRVVEVSQIQDCPNRERELAARLKRDGISMTHAKKGDFQYIYHDPTLAPRDAAGNPILGPHFRRLNGSTLGEVSNQRTGETLKLSRDGITAALGMGAVLAREAMREDEGRERTR